MSSVESLKKFLKTPTTGAKKALLKTLQNKTFAAKAVGVLVESLKDQQKNQKKGELLPLESVKDPKFTAAILELLHECLKAGANISSGMVAVTNIIHLDRNEDKKTHDELYMQYRATALLAAAGEKGVKFPQAAQNILLGKLVFRYMSDKETNVSMHRIYQALAEQGTDIGPAMQRLLTHIHNKTSVEDADSALTAAWAAVRTGFGTGKDENRLKELISECVYTLKPKNPETLQEGAVGCLLNILDRYPKMKRHVSGTLKEAKIQEPKRPKNDFQKDLIQLFQDIQGTK